jgi:ribosome-binding factor A
MPRDFSRTDRIADAIKRQLALLIQHEINDPRLVMVNINDVTVTRDLAIAKVYVTFVGHDETSSVQMVLRRLIRHRAFCAVCWQSNLVCEPRRNCSFFTIKPLFVAKHSQA